MKKITVSAPGKLMLFGEHAVVYGRPCIVTAVDQRMILKMIITDDSTFQLNAPDVKVKNYKKPLSELGEGMIPKGAKFVEIAARNFFDKYKVKTGLKITTKSDFSSKLGFGSSSASTVCAIYALSELFEKKLSKKQIFDLSYKTVLDIQGKGSGFDVAAATYGGTLYFVKAGKVIKPLKIKDLPLIVGYSGIKTDTVTIINQVSQKAKKFPKVIENIYNSINGLINRSYRALLQQDFETVGALMNFNQGYLVSLGVSSKKLDNMINSAKDAGAYGAKLSGAGVGDCMIALAPLSKVSSVKKAIKKAGGQIINVKTNVEGVKIEG